MKTKTQYPKLIADLPKEDAYYILTDSYYADYDGYEGRSAGTNNYIGIYVLYTEEEVRAWVKDNFERINVQRFTIIKAIPLKVETTVSFSFT